MDHGELIAMGTLEELTQMVGQHETLVLKLHQEGGGVDLVGRVQDLPGVHQASSADGEVVLNVASAEAALPQVLGQASELGLSVRTVEIREPNLETVFLHLTGRALRD
jgi:ABC-2 type transport system ATP-binding protein